MTAQSSPTPIPNLPHFTWQNPRLTGYVLTDIAPLDSLTAYAAGARGTVVKTTDGGRHWQVLNTGTRNDIVSISFFDAQHGWIAYNTPSIGYRTSGPGEVRYTADGGVTWVRRPLNNGHNSDVLSTIRARGPASAFILGSGIRCDPRFPCGGPVPAFGVSTTNSGVTWTQPAPRMFTGHPNFNLIFYTPNTWIIGLWPNAWQPALLRTDDGGVTLRNIAPDTVSLWYKQAQFFDARRGWVLAGTSQFNSFQLLYHTRDGGTTWLPPDSVITHTPAGARDEQSVNDLVFADPARGVGLIYNGLITTLDSGRTWQREPSAKLFFDSELDAGRLRAAADGSVWLIEKNTAQVWRTPAVGRPWRRLTQTLTPNMFRFSRASLPRAPQFFDARHGWAVLRNDTALLRTTSAGRQWQRVPLPRPAQAMGLSFVGLAAEDADFIDADTGFALMAGPAQPFTANAWWLHRTTNGGRTWVTQQLPVPFAATNVLQPTGAVDFVTAQRGAFVTAQGTLLVTQDGGQSWQQPTSHTRSALRRVVWRDSLTAYVAGGGGVAADSAVLLKTTDGGFTWARLPNAAGITGEGQLYLAPDGAFWDGSSFSRDEWQTRTLPPADSVTGYTQGGGQAPLLSASTVWFRNRQRGFGFGQSDLYRTRDAGRSWQRFAQPGSGGQGTAVDDYNAWILGRYGQVMHYSEKFIQTDTAATQRLTYCTGDQLSLAFDTTGFFSAAEDSFRIEISNKMGRFRPNETTLLPPVGRANASPLRATLPATLPPGTRYRLRVIRADSSLLGGDNQRDVTIFSRPAAVAVAPADSARFCQGDSVLLSAPAGFAAYRWTSGDTTATLWVTQATTYAVQVASGGRCFGPLSPPVTVRVTPTPAVPTFTSQPQTSGIVVLTSASPTGNQWFFNGQPIPSATQPTYAVTTATQSGAYSLQLTQRGCASPLSPPQTITVTGTAVEAVAALGLTLVPNPAQQRLRLTSGEALHEITLTDLSGRVVLRRSVGQVTSVELALPRLPTGTYLLTATTPTGRSATRRLLIAP